MKDHSLGIVHIVLTLEACRKYLWWQIILLLSMTFSWVSKNNYELPLLRQQARVTFFQRCVIDLLFFFVP